MQQVLFLFILWAVVANALKLASAPKKSEFSRSVFLKKVEKVTNDNNRFDCNHVILSRAYVDLCLYTFIYRPLKTTLKQK